MPDTRKHRGPHPADADLFRPEMLAILQQAVADYSWLLTREYSEAAALKLVGDRFQLTERQRIAVMRTSCSDQSLARRIANEVAASNLAGRELHLDGFNVLTTVEAALASGVILHARDGCFRDLASMHGSYRKVDETRPALQLIGETLAEVRVGCCLWFLDKPVSNSGRLAGIIRAMAAAHDWKWEADLVNDPDGTLAESEKIVATADSVILDACRHWFNLAAAVVSRRVPTANVIRLGISAGGHE